MTNSNMLLTRDVLSRLISMSENGIILDIFETKQEIENNNIFNYLINEYGDYFKDSLLIKIPEKINLLNNIYKNIINNNYNYLSVDLPPIYSNVDWYVEKNGVNLLICYIYDIYTFRLLKS